MVDAVPYQAYRSKRHSRNLSNSAILAPNVPTPPLSRPASSVEVPSVERTEVSAPSTPPRPALSASTSPRSQSPFAAFEPAPPPPPATSAPTIDLTAPTQTETMAAGTESALAVAVTPAVSGALSADKGKQPEPPGPEPPSRPRKTSTFRRITPAATRTPLPSSPLRPPESRLAPGLSSSPARHPDVLARPGDASRTASSNTVASVASSRLSELPPRPGEPVSRTTSTHSVASATKVLPAVPSPLIARPPTAPPAPPAAPSPMQSPAMRGDSLPSSVPSVGSPVRTPASIPSTPQSPSPSLFGLPRASAPYRPGFQPKGVYRPRTDEFVEARAKTRTADRIERARLERRLEKLVALHFGPNQAAGEKEGAVRPGAAPGQAARRASSFFEIDFSELRSKGAGELWRGVVQSQAGSGGAKEIRAAEQRITPWEEDSAVSACPFCTASFHPLTNRKHHCRLCGRIMCSLPVKPPQRPELCSILFVADGKTGRIEEVSEGVDYGVRRRQGPGGGEDERFLRGVRICRDCRPILLRQQYADDRHLKPKFVRLHEALVALEAEILDDLPVFQELMVALNTGGAAPQDATIVRKRLLDAFAQYDALSKHIQRLPCAEGSSQERVQAAVARRANLFLQKNMFPLQSIPKPRPPGAEASPSPQATTELEPLPALGIDPDSALAHALQPLLEQEARLEAYVAEAGAARRLEDARVLRQNLDEIRLEIKKVLAGQK